jgi:hypothetical protein
LAPSDIDAACARSAATHANASSAQANAPPRNIDVVTAMAFPVGEFAARKIQREATRVNQNLL